MGHLAHRIASAIAVCDDVVMDHAAAYADLMTRTREHALVGTIGAALNWDQEVIMPPGGADHRSRQMGWLAGVQHGQVTDPRIGELLSTLEGSPWWTTASAAERANVRGVRQRFDRQTKLPRALVEELAQTLPLAQRTWADAKKNNRFSAFVPLLTKVVDLKRQEARALCPPGGDLYDALLDEYEVGMKASDVDALFSALEPPLVQLLQEIAAKGPVPDPLAGRRFDVARQKIACELVAGWLGYDFHRGRLDESSHPFSSTLGLGDSRITTRYDHDLRGSLSSTMHEVGHALYEQGLDPAHHGTPVGEARMLGLHESQSRLWENAVGRSKAFWQHALPVLGGLFRDSLEGLSVDDVHRSMNIVAPSFIRTEADEVTYNLHILIRFRLERALLSGDLDVVDLPGAWNEAYARTLGITPGDDRVGCLQDVHWSVGAFGYFPTYTLGNLYAAQLFDAAVRAIPDLEVGFSRGAFAPLLQWLRTTVHHRGTDDVSAKIVQDATGMAPSVEPLLTSLRTRLSPLYGL